VSAWPSSYVVKFERAEEHRVEAERLLGLYVDSHPYETRPVVEDQGQMWQLHFTEQPSPFLPITIGDMVHNLRSGLNHLLVLCTDRENWRKVQFPIFTTDPFEFDPATGEVYKSREGNRRTWRRYTTGLSDDALAVVKRLQPYDAAPDETSFHGLHLLEELSNTDKHREFVAVGIGMRDPTIFYQWPGMRTSETFPGTFKADAKVGPYPPEMEVQIAGTPIVILSIGEDDFLSGDVELPGTFDTLMRATVRAFQCLEPFIKS
jgi:hypothetical protein